MSGTALGVGDRMMAGKLPAPKELLCYKGRHTTTETGEANAQGDVNVVKFKKRNKLE